MQAGAFYFAISAPASNYIAVGKPAKSGLTAQINQNTAQLNAVLANPTPETAKAYINSLAALREAGKGYTAAEKTAQTAQTAALEAARQVEIAKQAAVDALAEEAKASAEKEIGGSLAAETNTASHIPTIIGEEDALQKDGHFGQDELIQPEEHDTINQSDKIVHRSVGAVMTNEDRVFDFESNQEYRLAPGSKLSGITVFAGKGAKNPYYNAWKYSNKIGGEAEDWQHARGYGMVRTDEGDWRAELHWSQHEEYGIHDIFVKRWIK